MGSNRTTGTTERRRFVVAVTASCLVFLALGVTWGQSIGMQLQKTPTTTNGWLFVGWLVAGPPYLIALLAWHERHRLSHRVRLRLTLVLALWIGLSWFILPAKVHTVDHQFGTAALVGDPLSAGWAWGAMANGIGLAFTGLVLLVLRRSVPGRPTARQIDVTVRFLERAWLVLLAVSLWYALYAPNSGPIHTGT